jgi:hypothetical protein
MRKSIIWCFVHGGGKRCLGAAPESPITVQLGCDPVTEMAMAYGLHRFHAHQTIQ